MWKTDAHTGDSEQTGSTGHVSEGINVGNPQKQAQTGPRRMARGFQRYPQYLAQGRDPLVSLLVHGQVQNTKTDPCILALREVEGAIEVLENCF